MDTMREIAASVAESLETLAEKVSAAAAEALPTVSGSDNGKVLTVAGGEWAAAAPAAELPAVTSADAGKVLTVDSSGHWVAAALPD